MAKYILTSASAIRKEHEGLQVTAFYKREDGGILETPQKLVVFNSWPPVEMEAEVVVHKLGGVYKYPNGTLTNELILFCPKTKEGLYMRGYSPNETIVKRMKMLTRVKEI